MQRLATFIRDIPRPRVLDNGRVVRFSAARKATKACTVGPRRLVEPPPLAFRYKGGSSVGHEIHSAQFG
jgi:hypothetical protein